MVERWLRKEKTIKSSERMNGRTEKEDQREMKRETVKIYRESCSVGRNNYTKGFTYN